MRRGETRDRIDAYLDFRAGLRDVLASGDAKQFRGFLRDAGEDYRDPELMAMSRWDEESLLPLMHRMTIADHHLAEHHGRARAWLREHHLPLRVRSTGYGWAEDLRRRYRSVDAREASGRSA